MSWDERDRKVTGPETCRWCGGWGWIYEGPRGEATGELPQAACAACGGSGTAATEADRAEEERV